MHIFEVIFHNNEHLYQNNDRVWGKGIDWEVLQLIMFTYETLMLQIYFLSADETLTQALICDESEQGRVIIIITKELQVSTVKMYRISNLVLNERLDL